MNKQFFMNGDHKFPVTTETFEFLQQQIFLVARLCSLAGTNVIIKQPAPAATVPSPAWRDTMYDDTTAGLVIIDGKLYPLYGDSKKSCIAIMPVATDTILAGTESIAVRSYTYAYYNTSGTPVSQFTTLDNIVRLMARLNTLETTYMTETAIRALVQAVQTNLNTTNTNLNTLTTRVKTIEDNYKTAAQINDLLADNAQHHMPKGSIIDWYGVADCDHIPYGFVPCGCFFAGSASQFAPDGAGTKEMAKWRTKYASNKITIATHSINSGTLVGIRISACNGQTVPDLTDLFVVQAGGSYPLGKTGGEPETLLTKENIPSHTHTPSVTKTNGSSTYKYVARGLTNALEDAGGDGTCGGLKTTDKNLGGVQATEAKNLINISVSNEYWGGKDGVTQKHNNMPPYFALYKLIKVI